MVLHATGTSATGWLPNVARRRLDAWMDGVELLVRQAEAFGLSADDINLPGSIDPSVDFSPDPPTDRYAGRSQSTRPHIG